MSSIVSDFERSKKSPKTGPSNYSCSSIYFSHFAEDLLTHLKQPGVCRPFFGVKSWKKMPSERNDRLKLRSKRRHLHIFSQLENLELGQNLHGRRSLSSTILNSECREYRFDQTFGSQEFGDSLEWKNRKIIMKKAKEIISYDELEKVTNLSIAQDDQQIQQVFLVDCEQNNRTEKYALVLRPRNFCVFNLNNSRNPTKKFILPSGFRKCNYIKMDWNKKHESLFIKIGSIEKTCVLLFDISSLEFVTSFVMKHDAIKFPCGEIKKLTMKQDILQIRTEKSVILYSFLEYWENDGNSRRIPEISDGSELPIVFEISKFKRPLFNVNEKPQYIHMSPSIPFICGFPQFSYHSFGSMNLEHSEQVRLNFGHQCNFPENVCEDISEFEMFTKNHSCLIFADDSTSTFFVFEKCDLVKYFVSNCEKTEQVWKTTIFPNVEDRNFHRRKSFERAEREKKDDGTGQTDPRQRMYLYEDRTLRQHMKIYNTYQSEDGENIIVNLSIDYNRLLPNGYFCTNETTEKGIMQFVYIIDNNNGEILRIIPIARLMEKDWLFENSSPCPFTLEEDILTISKEFRETISNMEIWELVEPQQFIYDNLEDGI